MTWGARLRVAADTCAAQELRVVLGAVADDEPVDDALAALS